MTHMPLIDCRSETAFLRSHHKQAINIPTEKLLAHMHLLPRNTIPIRLCGTGDELKQAKAFLQEKGYQIEDVIKWSSEMETQLISMNQLTQGNSDVCYWQAATVVQKFIDLTPGITGKGLDIGCGAGRDSVFLAKHGWQMTGIDRNPEALQRLDILAASQNTQVEHCLLDTETGKDPFVQFDDQSFDLICVVRYLHRPLFPYIKRLLKPKGYIVYQTFMQGCEAFGSPKNPNFLLKPNELADIFDHYQIIVDEVIQLDDGRPMSMFIAQK